jgi:hypothetical protein
MTSAEPSGWNVDGALKNFGITCRDAHICDCTRVLPCSKVNAHSVAPGRHHLHGRVTNGTSDVDINAVCMMRGKGMRQHQFEGNHRNGAADASISQ